MKDSISILNTSLSSGSATSSNPTQVDLSTKGWTELTLQATVTNGGTGPTAGVGVTIWYAFSDTAMSGAAAVTTLNSAKRPFNVYTVNTINAIYSNSTSPLTILGDYLYIWVDKGLTGQAVTLALTAIECGVAASVSSMVSVAPASSIITGSVALTTQLTTFTVSAANTSRIGWFIFNTCPVDLYLKFGSTCTSTDFTFKLSTGAYYEMPLTVYTGIITAYGAAGSTGTAINVTELTGIGSTLSSIGFTPATSATVSSVTVTTQLTVFTLSAANANRVGWVLFNKSTADGFVKFGSGASSTDFSIKIKSGEFYEMPVIAYTGIITGYWGSGSTGQSVNVTELLK